MEIMKSIGFPTNDNDWIKKVLIGGILLIIPIIHFVCTGYYLRAIKGGIEGRNNMPEWKEWGDLFIKGIMLFIITFVYLVIPVMMASIIMFIPGLFESMMVFNTFFILAGSLICFIILILANLMFPMSLAMFANEGSFGDAFKINEIISRINSVFLDYLIAIIVVNILFLFVLMVAWIPIIGWAALFYVMVAAGNIYGEAFANSTA
jgi:membrane-associated HD superfamily phosphohydrolase